MSSSCALLLSASVLVVVRSLRVFTERARIVRQVMDCLAHWGDCVRVDAVFFCIPAYSGGAPLMKFSHFIEIGCGYAFYWSGFGELIAVSFTGLVSGIVSRAEWHTT